MRGIKNLKVNELFNIEKGSLQSSKSIEGAYHFIVAGKEWKTHETYTHDCEALVFAMGASGSLGRTHYVNDKFISSDLCFILTPKNTNTRKINMKFYYFYFNTFREEIVKKTATGTSKLAINLRNFSKLEIPYFDLEYQQLYTEKIKKIEYYQQQLKQVLTHNLNDITALKQQILTDAIQGNLVPQNKNDEPASVLLKRIKEEKEQLINEKKIKKEKILPGIIDEEEPFKLPHGWKWTRFSSIMKGIRYGTSKKCDYNNEGTPVLRIPNISNSKITHDDMKYAILDDKELNELKLKKDDLLLIRSNGSTSLVGRSAIIREREEGFCFAGYLIRVRIFTKYIDVNYINLILNSNFVRQQIEVPIRTTTGVKNINTTEIGKLYFPIPPINEQKRIIEKINQLMLLCDVLEASIEQSKQESETLMKAVLQEAFTVKGEVII